jgi:hypothetical protein
MGLLLIIGAVVAAAGGIFGYAAAFSAGAAPAKSALQAGAVLSALYFSPALCVFSASNGLQRIRNGAGWKAPLGAHFVWCMVIGPLSSLPVFVGANLLGSIFGLSVFYGDASKVMLVVPGVMLVVSLLFYLVSIPLAVSAARQAADAVAMKNSQ